MRWQDSEAGTILVEGQQEAIIDRGTFNKVQERIASNPRTHLRNWTTSHLLSGIVKCEECGSSMSNSRVSSKGRIYHYYGCNNYSNKKICAPNLIRKHDTEEKFKKEFKEIINEKDIREKVVEGILEEQSELTQSDATVELQKDELELLRAKQNNLINTLSQDFSEESTNVIVDNMNRISEEIKEIEEELEIELKKQEKRERSKLNKRDIAEILNNFDSFMSVIDELDARQLALSMIERVETKDKVISKIETKYNQVYEVS